MTKKISNFKFFGSDFINDFAKKNISENINFLEIDFRVSKGTFWASICEKSKLVKKIRIQSDKIVCGV